MLPDEKPPFFPDEILQARPEFEDREVVSKVAAM